MIREEAYGACVLQIAFPYRDAAVAFALSRASEIVVLDPPEVRDGIVAAAQSLLTTYLGSGVEKSTAR